ncbi:hypothetical protein JXC34_03965, partial [Candidatus Woesearchaeota archaeon]|nr:hypothetical protein [Candidatus Woesearchaeota archaeon]
STAMGMETIASEEYSTAIGYMTQATGSGSTAMGYNTVATAFGSTAMGSYTNAIGGYSTAMGSATTANGYYSTAMGKGITANGDYVVAIALNDQTGVNVTQPNTMSIMGGKVGIDTVAPEEALDVNGNAVIRGDLTVEGDLFLNSNAYIEEPSISIQSGIETIDFTREHGFCSEVIEFNKELDRNPVIVVTPFTDGSIEKMPIFSVSKSDSHGFEICCNMAFELCEKESWTLSWIAVED